MLIKRLNKIIVFILTIIMISTTLIFSACAPSCSILPSSDSQQGNNSGNGGQNQNGDNNNNDGNTSTTPDYSKYSKIMQAVLTDSYYKELLGYAYNHASQYHDIIGPYPYSFLKNQGYDVEKIKNETFNLDIDANSYIYYDETDSLYMSLKVENASYSVHGNYYTNYVLKYKLSKQEYEEFKMLSEGGYLQAYFFIQELDNQRTPQVLSKTKWAVSSYKDMANTLRLNSNVNTANYSSLLVDLLSVDIENKNLVISIRPNYYNFGKLGRIGTLNVKMLTLATFEIYDNNVVCFQKANAMKITNLEEYQANRRQILSCSEYYRVDRIYQPE